MSKLICPKCLKKWIPTGSKLPNGDQVFTPSCDCEEDPILVEAEI